MKLFIYPSNPEARSKLPRNKFKRKVSPQSTQIELCVALKKNQNFCYLDVIGVRRAFCRIRVYNLLISQPPRSYPKKRKTPTDLLYFTELNHLEVESPPCQHHPCSIWMCGIRTGQSTLCTSPLQLLRTGSTSETTLLAPKTMIDLIYT